MKNNKFQARLVEGEVLIADGAMGTGLQGMGLPIGTAPEAWVLERSDAIQMLSTQFVQAGAEILLTCTFGGTRMRLAQSGLAQDFETVNRQAVEITRSAAKGTDVLVGGSMGPLGILLKPYGEISIERAEAEFSAQAVLLSDAGVDLIVIETQYAINEASAAIRGVRAADADIPIICSFSFDRNAHTWMGNSVKDIVDAISKLPVDVLGINCGRSLKDNIEVLQQMKQLTDLPIWFKPNAGIPVMEEDGVSRYPVTPAEMGAAVSGWLEAGVKIVGGCCGTSPAHLAAISDQVRQCRTH